MTEAQDIVRIDDLADPVTPDRLAEIKAAMTQMGETISLTPETLVAAAVARTGVHDLGDGPFLDHLGVLCRALEAEGNLSAAGRTAVFFQVNQIVVNRLLLRQLMNEHPEIEEEEIAKPIFICGLPRTGTTHLHELLASDPSLRFLPYWEGQEPFLVPSERPAAGEPDPRIVRAGEAIALLDVAAPHMKRMHEMAPERAHEEIPLLAISGSSMYMETIAAMPSWRDHYLATDQTFAYEELRVVLKALQWLRGGTRWVLKSPQHIEQFPALMRVFPDATFVVTHRDPVSVTASLATMFCYISRLNQDHLDLHATGGYWADRLERMLRTCMSEREVLPTDRTIDVRFHEFMADEPAMVERIYTLAEHPFTSEVRSRLEATLASNPRGRHGRIAYDLSQFGIDPEERRRALAAYVDHFAVHWER